MPTAPPVDPGAVRAALGAPTRRTVTRTGVWSVPVIAAAMAAPAFAASQLPVCTACSGTVTPVCFISTGGGGTCRCGPSLVCVGTGPLNIANVCVGTGLGLTTCSGTPCVGVCISNSGGALTAINTLLSTVTGLINATAACTTNSTGSIPNNICVTPVAGDGIGDLGAICLITNGGGLLGVPLTTAINLFTTTLNGLGLGPASTCRSPYSCKPGTRLDASGGLCAAAGFNLTVGFCRC